ncbi:MAG: nucleotidyl transferase AbiEii/AbiGii toxin family protein [Gemmatimonadales bacterium]
MFVRPLNEATIPYLVTGGIASIVYGEPRFTRDIDLVLALQPEDASVLAGLWSAADYYVPPVEVIAEEARRTEHGHFNVLHHETGLRADCYLAGRDPLQAWALERPQVEQVGPDPVRLAPIEYVVLQKLRYFRIGGSERHLRDVAAMIRVSGAAIDPALLGPWLERLGLEEPWRSAQAWREPE